MAQKQYEAKEVIFREGDVGDVAYTVTHGKVELLRQSGNSETQVAIIDPGGCFGENAILAAGSGYITTARAVVPSKVETIDAAEFTTAVKQMLPAASSIVQSMTERYRSSFIRREEKVAPGISKTDIKKITIAPGSADVAKQFKDIAVSPANLPFRIGGFPTEDESQRNRHAHLNIASSGPPLMVSKLHCEIAIENDGVILNDLGSRFATVVNGNLIGRGRGKYQAPLAKGKNEVVLGGLTSPYKLLVTCE